MMEQYAGPQRSPSLPHQGVTEEPRIRATEAFLLGIVNWYSTMSPLDPERSELKNAGEIHDFLETCKARKLPFLVLVCPPEMTQMRMGPPTFKIFGVAFIDVLYGVVATENSIGDLHVYVRPGYTKKGFGSMLVDCILSICDEYYRHRYSYEWRPLGPVELHVLRLKLLVCNLYYTARLEGKYFRTQQWLKDKTEPRAAMSMLKIRCLFICYCVDSLMSSRAGRDTPASTSSSILEESPYC